ncbi:MAG: hypothetical protein SOX77_05395 [Candidatus Borkfalkiaceae bacterium]|nr:hypothetical protein [Christensenellaceae bacterium]
MKLKRIICLVIVSLLILSAGACVKLSPEDKTLAAPTGISVSQTGRVKWNEAENAEGYTVFIDGEKEADVTSTVYDLTDLTKTQQIYVKAFASGYETSPASETVTFNAIIPKPDDKDLKVALSCTVNGKEVSTVKNGETVIFAANVSGSEDENDKKVKFTVENPDGALTEVSRTDTAITFTANEVSGDKPVKVTAVCVADEKVSVTKAVTVVAKTELTQGMLSALCGEREAASFDGFVLIDVYKEVDLGDEVITTFVQSNTVTMRTAMEKGRWFAEFENANTGISQQIFCESDDEGYACETGIDFKNQERRLPVKDENGEKITWHDSGYYNGFKGLTLADFDFDSENWRWRYVHAGDARVKNIVSSCDPYNFYVSNETTFELIIDGGEVIGICAVSGKDYSIVSGYMAIQKLFVSLDTSENAVVPQMPVYTKIEDYTDAATKAEYRKLQAAIANMQALDSYKTEFINISAMRGLTTTSVSGYQEIVTDGICYFRPYDSRLSAEEDKYTDSSSYGYRDNGDGTYNTFFAGETGFEPTRAYKGDFKNIKPSFDFCAEIFNRGCYVDEENGLTRFVADEAMSTVASLFYYGVGNDISLYSLFATVATSGSTEFATYVDVQQVDGEYYIVASGFYYSIDAQGIYGVVDITYSDFNSATVSDGISAAIGAFKAKRIPSSWADVSIIVSTESDELKQADKFFEENFFGKGNVPALSGIEISDIPFFGDADNGLGDCFGLGMIQKYIKSTASGNKTIDTIKLYYDVPLGTDYTIDASLDTLDKFLKLKGFEKATDGSGEYRKAGCNLVIRPADESLDLFVYIWAE